VISKRQRQAPRHTRFYKPRPSLYRTVGDAHSLVPFWQPERFRYGVVLCMSLNHNHYKSRKRRGWKDAMSITSGWHDGTEKLWVHGRLARFSNSLIN